MADEKTTEVVETEPRRIALDDEFDAHLPSTGRQDPAELEEPAERGEPSTVSRETPTERPAPIDDTKPAAAKGAGKTVLYKGESLSIEEFANRGLLDNLITTAEKYIELQRKHEELVQQKAAEPTAPEAVQPALTQEQILEIWGPEVKKAVADGYLTQDFVDSWPDEAAQLLMHRDLLYEARQRLEAVEGVLNQLIQAGTANQWQDYLVSSLDQLAQREDSKMPDGFFATLKEPAIRSAFVEYLKELKPRQDQLVGDRSQEFLAGQFVAFNREAWAEAMRIQGKGGGVTRQERKRNATGESPGPRGATQGAPDDNGKRIALDDEIDSMLPQS